MCDKKVLNFCSQNIAGIIDFDESASESRLCIKIGYDEELDQWKQLYAGLPDLLNKIAQDIRPDVDPTFKEMWADLPKGYLLAIPVTEDMSDQLPTLDGWDFQFASENAMYFKGDKMRDMDTHLGDIHTFIVEREIEHLFALQEAICQHASVLLQIADLFAELDCNGSGKSIYLKQIALIVLLAHVGSFVPAEGARIGICDQILTSIQARHSVSRLQSSFLLDVSQVGFALRQCTPRSLVLFDEIGKGTDATDGAALFAATVRHLLERPEGCPKTVVATHFHEAFHPAVLPDSLPFQTAHMEVMFTDDSTANGSVRAPGDEMVFLFRLAPGLALTSNAAHLARVFLVPEDVVQRAEHVAELARTHNLAALLLEDDTPSSNSKVKRTSQRGHADSISGGEELSEAGRAAQLRRQEEQAKVEVAERRMRAFLEWELVEDQLDGLDVTDTDAGGSNYPDLIRQGLARIMAAC
ncbi:unnamed protein product [Tilletia controversa]|nr:unnamed protein product [Tilletia controversa]